MELWIILILAIAIPLSLLLSSFFLFLRCRRHRHRQPPPPPPPPPPPQFISDHETQLPKNPSKLRLSKNSLRFHHLPQSQSRHHHHLLHQETSFNWDSHPNLISIAAKNGWPGFVFADRASIPRSTSSPLWGLCAVCDGGRAQEFAGERISSASSEALQTVRINPSGTNSEPVSVRMNLPLPGPQLNRASFPQEAYFEITILYIKTMDRASRASKRAKDGPKSDSEDDRLKLIEESAKGVSDIVDDGVIEGKRFKSPSASAERKHKNSVVSLGLMVGGSPVTNTTPGTYRGSVGFHSDGSVYLDGK